MSIPLLTDEPGTDLALVTLTVEQYHRMLETGILPEGGPIELLDGLLVYKDRGESMTVHPLHRLIVNRLMQLVGMLQEYECHLQLQNPITIRPDHEPEPDGAIVYGSVERYAQRHPGPAEVSCVIEVAESSLDRDRTTKQRIYATAGIPQYIIINIVARHVETYEQPDPLAGRYRQVTVLTADHTIPVYLPNQQRLDIPAAQWLP